MRTTSLLSLAASFSSALALYKGFNYGTADPQGNQYYAPQYEDLFNTAAGLAGTNGEFNAARFYTMIAPGTTNGVGAFLPAAQSTNTYLLLGLFVSGGDAEFQNELSALTTAASQFAGFADHIVGISVGSEDLYRISPIAAQQGSTNPGAEPSTLVSYINQVRSALKTTAWANVPIGHVDTSTAWQNGTNDIVAEVCDFVGVDVYPYFQNTEPNSVSVGENLLETAMSLLTATVKSKNPWITETGWPVSGPTENQAVPSVANAQEYWDTAGCGFAFPNYNTFWYTLQDYGSSPSFGVVGQTLSTTPLYDLSCNAVSNPSSSSSAAAKSSSAPAMSSSAPAMSSPAVVVTSTPPAVTSMSYQATETVWETFYETVQATTCCPVPETVTVQATHTVSITTPVSTATGCPANIAGPYQTPVLIVPVSSSSPNTAYGTSYFASIDSTNSTIFTFNIPQSYSGKECSLVFLFPEQSQLETSSFTFNNMGGLVSHYLNGNANTGTTYANMPQAKLQNGAIQNVMPGNSYVISSDSCPAGSQVSFAISSVNGLALSFFEDYNPSPLGVFIRAC